MYHTIRHEHQRIYLCFTTTVVVPSVFKLLKYFVFHFNNSSPSSGVGNLLRAKSHLSPISSKKVTKRAAKDCIWVNMHDIAHRIKNAP